MPLRGGSATLTFFALTEDSVLVAADRFFFSLTGSTFSAAFSGSTGLLIIKIIQKKN